MESNSAVTESFLDKNRYRLYLSTLWSNLVMEPDQLGLAIEDLEQVFDLLNERARDVLGGEDPIRESFQFISSSAGEREMAKAKLTRNHRDLLTYFSSMILNPDAHKKWMDEVRRDNTRFR